MQNKTPLKLNADKRFQCGSTYFTAKAGKTVYLLQRAVDGVKSVEQFHIPQRAKTMAAAFKVKYTHKGHQCPDCIVIADSGDSDCIGDVAEVIKQTLTDARGGHYDIRDITIRSVEYVGPWFKLQRPKPGIMYPSVFKPMTDKDHEALKQMEEILRPKPSDPNP